MLALALFAVFLPAELSAQDEPQVSMKLDVVAWGDEIGGLTFKSGKKDGTITAKAFTYSDPVNYSGPALLEIHQSGDGRVVKVAVVGSPEDKEHESIPLPLDDSGKEAEDPQTPMSKELAKRREKDPTLVALVPLPTNSRRATVLLAPSSGGTYQGYVIDDDPSKLPPGRLRVHNLSPVTIAMKFSGGQRKEMKPRETFAVKPANGQTVYQLAYLMGDEWMVQENNIVPVPADEQIQLIVLKSKNQFFLSADGASGGFLQLVTLRRRGGGGES